MNEQVGSPQRATFLQTITESMAEGLCMLDTQGRIVFLNAAAHALLGWPTGALLGRRLSDLIFRHDADGRLLDEAQHPLRRVLYEGQTLQDEDAFFTRQDGTAVPVAYTASPAGSAEAMQGVVILFRDVSWRRTVAAELQELKRRLARSQEKQRLRLAQDLHDGPLQDLYAVRYQLQALRQASDDSDLQERLEAVKAQFLQVSEAIRAICNDLRPPALSPFGLEAAIRSHAEQMQQLYPHLTLNLDLTPDSQMLPEYVRLALFRVYQEMISNVARHAQATSVLVRFDVDEDEVLLEIQDNGIGFEVPQRWIELARQGHLGLAGAAERVEEIDGRLMIFSTPGEGTIVRIRAPRQERDELTQGAA